MTWLRDLLRILAPFLGPIGDFFVKFWRNRGPSEVVTEAEKAGAATQAVKDTEAHDAEVQKAADAGAAVDARIASDDGLREYERTDKNNRDNASGRAR